ncbi:MAG TPA: efflux RND transporter permease subunit [Gemmatimonadaceae bacterium]|nr:efflux RND transporter permease subunit [Gemmatimonadaceae bacterium]
MVISDFAIKRPLITVVAMLTLVIFGAFALWQLQTDEFPEVNPPVVLTAIIYPGASPDQVEREILEPVEEAITGISGVDKVFGEARDGYAQIVTIFFFEKDLQEATQDIRDAISGIRNDLPTEMEEPILRRFNPADQPIIQLALASEAYTPAQLTRLADPAIVREFRSLPGVAQVDIVGKVERELTVQVRPDALQAAGVSVADIVQALETQNLAVPVGRINGTLDERTIRLRGRLEGPQDFMQLVVAERNGQIIRLGQVADVLDGTEEGRTFAIYNGKDAVGILITKSRGYSTTDVSARVRERVEQIQETLPKGVRLDVVRDAGERVASSVRNVQEALVEGAVLTVLVVFLFLNSWRSTVITGLALPVSVLASFIAVWALGFKLETMSLLGLSLAIGILIDDAIVVRENIVRHVEMGKDHFTAAREGTDEIGLAVAATTFSIVSVFVPVGFMYGEAGMWFKPFALTIACSVLVSLFVSFSLDPMLSAYWPDPHVPEHKKAWITKRLDTFNRWFNRQAENYRHVIAWALDHRLAMMVLALGTFVSSFMLFSLGMPRVIAVLLVIGALAALLSVHTARSRLIALAAGAVGVLGVLFLPTTMLLGGGFFPGDDQSEVNISVETPPGSNLEYTRLKAEEAARIAREKHPEVLYTFTTAGGQSGAVDKATIYVRLTKRDERKHDAEAIAAEMRDDVKVIGGATAAVFTNDFQGDQKQIQIQLRGTDATVLNQAAERILAEVRQVPNAVDVGLSSKGQKPELDIQLNRGLAGTLGVTVGQVAQSLRPAFAGIDAGDWVDPSGETRDVYVRLAPEARRRIADLEQLPLVIQGPSGAPTMVPLGQLATIRPGRGPAVIEHLDRDRVVTVQANVAGRSLGEVMGDINKRIETVTLPPGVRITQGGEVESQNEVFGRIGAALAIAVFLMYLILVMQFGSFLEPLAILLSLPLSLIGVTMALALTGNTINIMSLIGVILLAGIVAKNAILLIDFAKWARDEQGMERREAIIQAGAIRLRPILMTTFALIAGMIPVALGGGDGAQFRAPLGVAVIGGVITSTLLTLLVIPTFYEILDETKEWLGHKLGLGERRPQPEPQVAGAVGD